MREKKENERKRKLNREYPTYFYTLHTHLPVIEKCYEEEEEEEDMPTNPTLNLTSSFN